MLNETVQEALNGQIKNELDSAYLYLAMAAHFESANLPGFARWMRLQSREEVSHALRIFDFIHERGGRVTLQALDRPPAEFQSPLDAFQKVLEHERKITETIHRLYELAAREDDYPTQVMLQWFITEQVEEERSAGEVVEKLRMIGDQGAALLMLDRELGEREADG